MEHDQECERQNIWEDLRWEIDFSDLEFEGLFGPNAVGGIACRCWERSVPDGWKIPRKDLLDRTREYTKLGRQQFKEPFNFFGARPLTAKGRAAFLKEIKNEFNIGDAQVIEVDFRNRRRVD